MKKLLPFTSTIIVAVMAWAVEQVEQCTVRLRISPKTVLWQLMT